MDRIWSDRNKVIFTAGVLCGTAIVLLFSIYSSPLWLEVETQNGGEKPDRGQRKWHHVIRNTHEKHTHPQRMRTEWNQFLPVFLFIACRGGKERKQRSMKNWKKQKSCKFIRILHVFMLGVHASQHSESSQDRCGGSCNWLPVNALMGDFFFSPKIPGTGWHTLLMYRCQRQ